MVTLQNATVVITGAASGMGRAMAVEFAEEGSNVVVVDVDEDGTDEVVSEITDDGGTAIGVFGDVSDTESVETVVETALEEYGTIDVLVNNAGILDDFAPAGDTSDDLWDAVIGVNLDGPFYLTREALPALKDGDEEGIVINTASIAGKVAGGGGAAYTASKHGLIGLTKHLSEAYGPDIRANAICPGAVKTGMTDDMEDELQEMSAVTPAERPADPEEIARVATFLASDDSSFIHGTPVNVDGGMLVDK